MNEFQATGVLVALFALRCLVPLALLAVMGYLMNRLHERWDREDAAREEVAPIPPAAAPAPRGARPALPCWVLRNCDEQQRANCPAYLAPSLACFVARLRSDGQLPAACADCRLYTAQPQARVRFSGD